MRSWLGIFGLVALVGLILLTTFLLLNPKDITTFSLVASSLLAALSAVASFATVYEMRQDRIGRSKPFIFVDFEMTGGNSAYWVIRNLGGGPATDVTLKFDPVPINYSGKALTDLAFFQRPIPIIVPGFEMKQFLDTSTALLNSDRPKKFKVVVTYNWEGGKRETQTFESDLERFYHLVVPPKTTPEVLKDMQKDLHKLSVAFSGAVQMGKLRIEHHEPPSWDSEEHPSTDDN